ncbi:MAG TPA: xylulokinase [Rhizobiaceae bacterium]|nr:xylulokinase [Rhizobiaceae bacterium]
MYLGLDLGTSGMKALLSDGKHVVASATVPLSVQRPHAGWSEQDPESWLAATDQAMDRLRRDHAAKVAVIRGIGLSGQMHGATLLDMAGKVLRPCILWNDTRSAAEAAELDDDPRFRAITGNIVFPGFTAPKLAWLRGHEPDIYRRVAKVLLPKDYLRYRLTGAFFSDMSDAAGTAWLDTANRRWSPELLGMTGLGEEHMPALVEGTAPTAPLRRDVASRWGIDGTPIVAGGAGDNAASACGVGTVEPGSAFVSLGTSGVLFAANDSYRPNAASAVHTFCHALPATWHQMGVILSATDSLNWLAGITGQDAGALTAALGERPAGPGKLAFLPYLSGERTPHNDAAIRGAFAGLDHASGREALTQAVLEGVAFALRDNLEALRAAGTTLARVTAVGGGARSHYWLATIANVLGIAVDIPADGDFGAAFGAARLGLIAAESADPHAICTPPATALTIEPDATLMPAYDEAWQHWRRLYPAVRGAKT